MTFGRVVRSVSEESVSFRSESGIARRHRGWVIRYSVSDIPTESCTRSCVSDETGSDTTSSEMVCVVSTVEFREIVESSNLVGRSSGDDFSDSLFESRESEGSGSGSVANRRDRTKVTGLERQISIARSPSKFAKIGLTVVVRIDSR